MRWRGWHFWKPEWLAGRASRDDGCELDLEAEFARRGLLPFVSEAVSEGLRQRLRGMPAGDRMSFLDGWAASFDLDETARHQWLENQREVREIQNMLSAFSDELSKLDEVLAVMSTYVRKMRQPGAAAENRILH